MNPLFLKLTIWRAIIIYPAVLFASVILSPVNAFAFDKGKTYSPPPSNNECSGATVLTSAPTCTNITATLNQATASAGIPAGCAAAGTYYDVWFSFTAAATTQTITVSNMGSKITSPKIQLYSGSCASLVSIQCGTSSITVNSLSIGATYYIRFSNFNADPSGTGNTPKFDICVTHTASVSLTLSRGPYLQKGNQTSITLHWKTNTASDSRVEVGTSFGTYPIVTDNATSTTDHVVTVTGLSADTKYWYRVGSTTQTLQGAADNYFKTLPLANPGRKLKFIAFGDCGRNSITYQNETLTQYQNFLSANSMDAPDAWILLGDNAYNAGTEAEYTSNFFGIYGSNILKNHKLYPSPGNHDYANSGTNQDNHSLVPYYTIFDLPSTGECGGVASNKEEFYSFDIGNVHFLALDAYGEESNMRLYDTLGAQAVWVKQDLAANTKKFTIAYWHHPPYTMGSHNSDTELDLVAMRNNFIRILERNGVDLIINGHSHDYERSYLLKGHYGLEGTFNSGTMAVSTSSAAYTSNSTCPYVYNSTPSNHGTVYVVAGSTGASGGVQAGYPHNAFPYSVNDGGVFYFEVEENRLDAKMIRRDGSIFDRFTIMKDVNTSTVNNIVLGNSVNLTASWVGNYNWNTAATTRSINVTPPLGTTIYTCTDEFGCITDQITVNVTGTLPVNVMNYSAALYDGKVNVKWSTATENNSKEFSVERSPNMSGGFQLVGKVNAAGQSSVVKNYSLVDPLPLAGISYYRLSQTDLDGRVQYFDVKKITNKGSRTFSVSQVANENGSLILQIKSSVVDNLKLTIYDMTGKEVIAKNVMVLSGSNQKEIKLKPGNFVWKISNSVGETVSQVTFIK